MTTPPPTIHPTAKSQASIASWVRTLILDYPEERRAGEVQVQKSSVDYRSGVCGQKSLMDTEEEELDCAALLHEKMTSGDQGDRLVSVGTGGKVEQRRSQRERDTSARNGLMKVWRLH